MRIFALSDPHLSVSGEKPMDVFGCRWNNHEQKIKENWTRSVSEEDLVIVPGDISWGLKIEDALPDFQFLHELPGKKLILKGNHDLWWTSLSKLNALFDSLVFLHNSYYDAGGLAVCGTRGWTLPGITADWDDHDEKIFRRELIRLDAVLKKTSEAGFERIIVALHYPPVDFRGASTAFTDIIEKYPVTDVIYGHLHGSDAQKHAFNNVRRGIRYRLVSSDCIGFAPVLLYDEELQGR
ncbi:MAG: metallophosphoesterase [Anaerovoracaceae bacterium]